MGLQIYEQGIRKTGFELEYKVGEILRSGGWSVINNKYYIDDQEENVREVDIVAYKVRLVKDILFYTALIISCKKSNKNVWALLSKRFVESPNVDWKPLHVWTNDEAIRFMVSQVDWRRKYYTLLHGKGVDCGFRTPDVDVFAFQELDKDKGDPKNDTSIFTAVTTLIKAQSYEMGVLPERKKNKSVYQFNLLSVIDSEVLRIYFDGDSIDVSSVEQEFYVSRYIVKKKETVARIHFLRSGAFEKALKEYDKLFIESCEIYSCLYDEFFSDVLTDFRRVSVFSKQFYGYLIGRLKSILYADYKMGVEVKPGFLCWDHEQSVAAIGLDLPMDALMHLNENVRAQSAASEMLERYYKYKGPFEFRFDDLPF